jgi:PadR family transcriptional regulator, regulatory protein PadR
MDRERLKGNLDLLLLSVLASGPTHGYAIISALRHRSAGTFDLPEGTIYPALHRLEDSGLLTSTWAEAEGRRRRVYGLTDQGVAALAAQQTEWRKFAGGVHAVLGWPAQAAWKLSGLLAAIAGTCGLAAIFLLHSPPVWARGVRAVQDGPGLCQCSIHMVPITSPAVMALPYAAMAAGGLSLLETRQLAIYQ